MTAHRRYEWKDASKVLGSLGGTLACVAAAMGQEAQQPVLIATDATFGSPMVYRIDASTARVIEAKPLTGTGTIGPTPLGGLAFDGQGRLIGFTPSTDNTVYESDRATGQATRIGPLRLSAREGGMTIAEDGTIFAARTGSPARLFTIDPRTGSGSTATRLDITTDLSGLATRDDGMLIGLDLRETDGPAALREIAPDTGATRVLAAIAAAAPLDDVGGMTIIDGPEGPVGYFVVTGDASGSAAELWRFDPYAGDQVLVGEISGADGTVAAVTGLAGLPCEQCQADLDGDCRATFFDFLHLSNWFDAGDARADLNGDGSIDVVDFLFFLGVFEAGC
ncbi:MAG: GC-type dockerin domain-anchored protein [Phycisphaerales bacterium]